MSAAGEGDGDGDDDEDDVQDDDDEVVSSALVLSAIFPPAGASVDEVVEVEEDATIASASLFTCVCASELVASVLTATKGSSTASILIASTVAGIVSDAAPATATCAADDDASSNFDESEKDVSVDCDVEVVAVVEASSIFTPFGGADPAEDSVETGASDLIGNKPASSDIEEDEEDENAAVGSDAGCVEDATAALFEESDDAFCFDGLLTPTVLAAAPVVEWFAARSSEGLCSSCGATNRGLHKISCSPRRGSVTICARSPMPWR